MFKGEKFVMWKKRENHCVPVKLRSKSQAKEVAVEPEGCHLWTLGASHDFLITIAYILFTLRTKKNLLWMNRILILVSSLHSYLDFKTYAFQLNELSGFVFILCDFHQNSHIIP